MKIFLLLLLVSSQVFAQSVAIAPLNTSEVNFPALSWENIKSRLRINYFNFATGPSLAKWDDNEVSDQGTKNREPVAMYHSFNVRYRMVGNLDFFMSPRFVTPMGDRKELRDNQDHQNLMPDDWDFGLYYTLVAKPNLNYAQIISQRVPYSVKSRNEQIDAMYVWQNQVIWTVSPAWRILHWTIFSYYDFNNQSTIERYRALFRTLGNYTINDKWMIQLGYELDMQHLNPYESGDPQHRQANYFKRYHSYSTVGIGYNPIPNWTLLPYIRSQDERNIRNETTVLGFMVMGRVL